MPLDQPGSIKRDFDAVENHRGDTFCKTALGIKLLPSSSTLRKRLPAQAGRDPALEFGHRRRPSSGVGTGRAANLSGLA